MFKAPVWDDNDIHFFHRLSSSHDALNQFGVPLLTVKLYFKHIAVNTVMMLWYSSTTSYCNSVWWNFLEQWSEIHKDDAGDLGSWRFNWSLIKADWQWRNNQNTDMCPCFRHHLFLKMSLFDGICFFKTGLARRDIITVYDFLSRGALHGKAHWVLSAMGWQSFMSVLCDYILKR